METNLFEHAVEQAKAGRRAEARVLLKEVLEAEPTNEMAWVWYSDCVDTIEERIEALETCARLIPDAKHARAGLTALKQAGILDVGRTRPVYIKDDSKGDEPLTKHPLGQEDAWVQSGGSSVFTVSPDDIPPDEFAEIEARSVAFLEENLDIHPPDEDPWAQLSRVSAAAEPRSRPIKKRSVHSIRQSRSKREVVLTTLTLLTFFVLFVLLLGAFILTRGA
jgi:hypothetical protein